MNQEERIKDFRKKSNELYYYNSYYTRLSVLNGKGKKKTKNGFSKEYERVNE